MSKEYAIETHGLTRYFGNKIAVDQLNLKVPRGMVFGFLGRNGSGKTTTIRMMLGLLSPTRGSARVLDEDSQSIPHEMRARIGYMTESHSVYEWMKVKDCARFQSSFYSQWNQKLFNAVIDHFELSPDARAKDLSRGERAGLSLALTLAPDPELLILDDPAIGLDPSARRSLMESMIYLTRKSDRTIFFSSHLIADVERVADEIAILDKSVLRAQCPLDQFRESVREVVLSFTGSPPETPKLPTILQSIRTDKELRMIIAQYNNETDQALKSLGASSIETVELSLEEAVTSYLGRRGERTFFLNELEEKA